MTFILAIQLEDSVIVATDHRYAIQSHSGDINILDESIAKMFLWSGGVVTGSGEYYVTERAFHFFKALGKEDVIKLPQCLNISRQIRELEVHPDHFQIQNTKLLFSCVKDHCVRLNIVERRDLLSEYEINPVEPMKIIVWMYNPDITEIALNLKNLFENLRDYADFVGSEEWVEYYMEPIAEIFKKQSQFDNLMSSSFDIYFQNKTGNYYYSFVI